jgi:hypothetical protein
VTEADGTNFPDGLLRSQAERFGMRSAVVLGQYLACLAGPVRDGALADLAAYYWKLRNRHGEAAGT